MANKDLWVFIETTEKNIARGVGMELLSPGRKLADARGGKLVAVVVGSDNETAVAEASAYGADEVINVENGVFGFYTTDAYTEAFAQLAKKYEPATILIGATGYGRDLAPRLACRLETGLTADCTALDIDEETGNVIWTRPAMGGNLMAQIVCPQSRPQIGTVRPGVFKKPEKDESRKAEIINEAVAIAPEQIMTRIVDCIREADNSELDIANAEIIVAGGRGMKGKEGFELLKKLADKLGGAVGATRPAVDEGWIAHSHQVGQTGKSVSPKLYIACGISGAIQHIVGMQGSDVIVAINKDPEAPIFGAATYGIVGDVFEVIPAMLKELG